MFLYTTDTYIIQRRRRLTSPRRKYLHPHKAPLQRKVVDRPITQ